MRERSRTTRRALVAGSIAGGLATAARLPTSARAGTQLPTPSIRAIYLNPLATTLATVDALIQLVAETELNAIVIDVKEDGVYLPTNVDLFREEDSIRADTVDLEAVLETLFRNEVPVIARVVTFRDTYVATARPDLAVLDSTTGTPWLSYDGAGWLNPLKQETWQAYAAFALELAERGFDEIQFDYVRFPSDGDMTTLDFGIPVDETLRSDTIAAFLSSCSSIVHPLGVTTSADVFGYTLLLDDIGIGQNVAKIARAVDVICPMLYPSHFPDGSIAVPGHPNDFPRETIQESLEGGLARIEPNRLRPWLQDFSLAGMSAYSAAEVRAQIDACQEAGTAGWMLWSADSVFSSDALQPAS